MEVSLKETYRSKSIISNYAVSAEWVAMVTYTRSNTTSKFVYSLQLHHPRNLGLVSSTTLEHTYNEDKRHLAIGPNYIAVHTQNFIELYSKDPTLTKLKARQHSLTKINDICISSDSHKVGVAGNGILLWDVYSDSLLQLPALNPSQWFNFIQFTRIHQRLVIAQINSLQVFRYNGTYQVEAFNEKMPNDTYINSIDSSPVNPDELVVGLQDTDPHYFSISQNRFFKKSAQSQPGLQSNIKQAKYMPDGRGFVSADLKGFGLWSDDTRELQYKAATTTAGVVSNAIPSQDGLSLYNFIWQEARIFDVSVLCPDGKRASRCDCATGSFWSAAAQSCIKLACLDGEVVGNSCRCLGPASVYQSVTGLCLLDCSSLGSTPRLSGNGGDNSKQWPYSIFTDGILSPFRSPGNAYYPQCECQYPGSFDSISQKCQVSCGAFTLTSEAVPIRVFPTLECKCQAGLTWDVTLLKCTCPSVYQEFLPQTGACQCIRGYSRNPASGSCEIDCTTANVLFSVEVNTSPVSCQCLPGYYFDVQKVSGVGGCKKNCSLVANTIRDIQDKFLPTCLCQEHYFWTGEACVVNCIESSETKSYDPSNSSNCLCPVNYSWRPQIAECAQDCSGQPHATGENATQLGCQCEDNFEWSYDFKECQIQCKQVPSATQYMIKSDQCECRAGFDWDPKLSACRVDCQQIENGLKDAGNNTCACTLGRTFNPQTGQCEGRNNLLIMGNVWITAAVVVSAIILFVVLVALIRFCCSRSRKDTEPAEIVETDGTSRIRKTRQDEKFEKKSQKKISLPSVYRKCEIQAQQEGYTDVEYLPRSSDRLRSTKEYFPSVNSG